jgi:hypothetical protein
MFVCISFSFDVLDLGSFDPEWERVGQSNLALE